MNIELIHILLIEDNPGDARLVKEMLNDLELKNFFRAPSLNLTQCERLNEALSLLNIKTFDIILVDLSLPDSQGVETVKAVCQIAPNLPIIVLSGQSGIEMATLAVQEGAQDYLLKGHIDSQLLMRSISYAMERKKKDIELMELASLDALTKVANRTFFTQRLTQAITLANRHQWTMAILFIDLDLFKTINDSFSHKVGDIVLQTIANRLGANLQASDTIARIGGDEFIVILHKIETVFSARIVVQRILDAIKVPIPINEKKLVVTASIGISLYPDNSIEEQTLLKYADMAMYDAKHAGGDNYKFYALEMTNEHHEKITLEKELQDALSNEKFILLYQPQLNLTTNMFCGVEALLHLVRGDGSLLESNKIIPIIEGIDLIVPVWEWILNTLLLQKESWNKNKFNELIKIISIDLSMIRFKKGNIIETIKKISEQNLFDKFQLEFGINENANLQETQPQIEMLKSHGFHIALDNFLAGSTSLSCLRTFQVDAVKIPEYLIQDIDTNKKDQTIVIGMINIAHAMGVSITAKGVETEAQMQFLRAHGCDKVQGSYICKPVDAKALSIQIRDGVIIESGVK